MDSKKIPLYIFSSKRQLDKKKLLILDEFHDKPEFDIRLLGSQEIKSTIELWKDIRKIIQISIKKKFNFIILCSENHRFTNQYDYQTLIENIDLGKKIGANILLGGIQGHFTNTLRIRGTLYWFDSFSEAQFIIIYNHFFIKILNEKFDESNSINIKLSEMTSNKFLFYPMISIANNDCANHNIESENNFKRSQSFKESINIRLKRIDNAYEKFHHILK